MLASPGGDDGSLTVRQDARVYAALLDDGSEVRHTIDTGRHAWVHVATGSLEINGILLETGDGAAVSDEDSITLTGVGRAETLVFDLA